VLPFLKPKKGMAVGVIIKKRQPDENPQENQDITDLESSMERLAEHLSAKDYKAAAECFKEAVKQIDEEPHEEGPHIEPHSYESQED